MKQTTNVFACLILLVVACSILACSENKQGSDSSSTDTTSTKQPEAGAISIDTFSSFPPAIDGCSCYFATDSIGLQAKAYIYVSDFDKVSYLKINGVLTKFTQILYKEISSTEIVITAQGGDYELTIKATNGKPSGDETRLQTGTITLTNKKGNKVVKKFYGECGC